MHKSMWKPSGSVSQKLLLETSCCCSRLPEHSSTQMCELKEFLQSLVSTYFCSFGVKVKRSADSSQLCDITEHHDIILPFIFNLRSRSLCCKHKLNPPPIALSVWFSWRWLTVAPLPCVWLPPGGRTALRGWCCCGRWVKVVLLYLVVRSCFFLLLFFLNSPFLFSSVMFPRVSSVRKRFQRWWFLRTQFCLYIWYRATCALAVCHSHSYTIITSIIIIIMLFLLVYVHVCSVRGVWFLCSVPVGAGAVGGSGFLFYNGYNLSKWKSVAQDL